MHIKSEIIRKALILVGSMQSYEASGNKQTKARQLTEEFVDSAIEETLLLVSWDFAVKQISNIAGSKDQFTEIGVVNDALKVAVIAPSNLEWYIENGKIYFKGGKLGSIFYYSGNVLKSLLSGSDRRDFIVPSSFIMLAALTLSFHISFALYSDSIFTEGLRRQYLLKLEEVRKIYTLDCNIVNSGRI